ncbi:MAG: phosphoenolpyruvate synthase, partial [Dehalococcoidia bacterium]|nr:phosphoenolpyruvate synthase [Dehalococcoidia bacterium]
MKEASVDDPRALESKAEAAQRLITSRPMPTEIASALEESYLRLAQMLSERDPAVAVRSSAIGEDQGRASFAGQYQSYLNVRGTDALIAHVQKCWSALWLPQALHYRLTRSEQNGSPAMAVVVQRLVPCTTSGVLFTANPLTGRRDEIVVNSAWGLAEVVVSGIVSPDTFVVDKETLAPREITLGQKDKVAQPLLAGGTTLIETPQEDRERASLSDSQLENLARMALAIESHFGAPQDIEWAFNDDSLFILQSRPITNLREQPSVGPFPIVWEREEDKKLWWTWDQIHYPRPLSP